MKGYGQFCPVAKATEVLGERWTFLVIRELFAGSKSFNDIRRGVPLMSPSLLSTRLKTLEEAEIVERQESDDGITYGLSTAGRELGPIIMRLGRWGKRWAPSEFDGKDLDPRLLMWDLHRRIVTTKFPSKRTVLYFEYTDCPASMRRYWLVVEKGSVDICLKDPGHEVDLSVVTDIRTMAHVWMGDIAVAAAQRKKLMQVTGLSSLKRDLGSWLGLSVFAGS